MTNYRVTVKEQEINANTDEVNQLDLVQTNDLNFHLLKDQKAYQVKLLQADYLNKILTVSVNGTSYELVIEDEYDQKVKEMGLLAVASQKINSVTAPMPGLIVDVLVKEGQEVTEGTPLLVLSAMKMENIITSQGEGIVKDIPVQKNDAVEKGQLMIELE